MCQRMSLSRSTERAASFCRPMQVMIDCLRRRTGSSDHARRPSGGRLLQPKIRRTRETRERIDIMTQVTPGRKGARVFPPPPKGFDAFAATKIELARHGLPPRPDPQTQPVLAALWEHIARRYGSFEHLEPKLFPAETATTAATTELEAGTVFLRSLRVVRVRAVQPHSFPLAGGDLDRSQFETRAQPIWSYSVPHLPWAWVPRRSCGNDCRCRRERDCGDHDPHRRASRPSRQPRRCDQRRPVLAR